MRNYPIKVIPQSLSIYDERNKYRQDIGNSDKRNCQCWDLAVADTLVCSPSHFVIVLAGSLPDLQPGRAA